MFSFEILFDSQFNFWISKWFENLWVFTYVVKLSGAWNQCFDGKTSFLNNQLGINEFIYKKNTTN